MDILEDLEIKAFQSSHTAHNCYGEVIEGRVTHVRLISISRNYLGNAIIMGVVFCTERGIAWVDESDKSMKKEKHHMG